MQIQTEGDTHPNHPVLSSDNVQNESLSVILFSGGRIGPCAGYCLEVGVRVPLPSNPPFPARYDLWEGLGTLTKWPYPPPPSSDLWTESCDRIGHMEFVPWISVQKGLEA